MTWAVDLTTTASICRAGGSAIETVVTVRRLSFESRRGLPPPNQHCRSPRADSGLADTVQLVAHPTGHWDDDSVTEHLASVFLSYSWADKPLARRLAEGLNASGCRVWIDEGELRIGDSLVESISEALDQVDFVVALVSAASVGSDWCRKEISLAMTGELKRQGVTVMPLRVGDAEMPPTLKDKLHLAVDPEDVPGALEHLLRDIRRHLEPPAPLPPRRRAPEPRPAPSKSANFAAKPASPSTRTKPPESAEPLRILGVDRDGISKPRNDGTRGSALYSVPFRLSAVPDRAWAGLFVQNWNHPPSFSLMHRPGIARVAGDRVVLDGTTVEEVAKYHQRTLTLAMEATNAQHAEHLRQQAAAAAARDEGARLHREEVERGLAALHFDEEG